MSPSINTISLTLISIFDISLNLLQNKFIKIRCLSSVITMIILDELQ